MTYQYFKTTKEKEDQKGVRFFKTTAMFDEIVEVCLATGETMRGRGNSIGIYTITRTSFLSNYLGMGYVESCSRQTYEKAFELGIKYLKSSKYKKI